MNYKEHWNSVYDSKTDEQLGWYEVVPEKTMQLIEDCNLKSNATILNVGAGTTILIDELLKKGFTNIIANDLSESALKNLKHRIKSDFNYNLECIVDDLTQPTSLQKLTHIDLWIDRAVLHFFLKEEEQQAYFELIKKVVAKNGFVLIAVFALDGAEKCSGLPLQRYDVNMLQQKLGDNFKLIDSFNYTFINPFGGERPYVYTLFQRQ
jgi:SAM-dependent methyltransferase